MFQILVNADCTYLLFYQRSRGRAVHDFCTTSDRGLAVIGGVCVPDLVEAKSPLGLARSARIACSVRVDWLTEFSGVGPVDDSAGIS